MGCSIYGYCLHPFSLCFRWPPEWSLQCSNEQGHPPQETTGVCHDVGPDAAYSGVKGHTLSGDTVLCVAETGGILCTAAGTEGIGE